MINGIPEAFDSELLSSKKTSIFVIQAPFRLHRKWKDLLSDLLCHQFSLFNPRDVFFCISSLLVQYIWWNTSLIFLSWFPRNYLTMLVLKSLCPFLPCLLCYDALPPNCGSVLQLTFGLSFLPLYHLSQLSPSLSSPLNSHSLIFRGLLDDRTKRFRVTLTSPVPCTVPGILSTSKYLLNELNKCISFPFKPASFSNCHLLS